MAHPTARQILKKAFGKYVDEWTPTVVRVGNAHPRVAYELSKGKAANGKMLYRLTFVLLRTDGATARLPLVSDSGHSLKDLLRRLAWIRKKLRNPKNQPEELLRYRPWVR